MKCNSENIINYYSKPDGEYWINYFRCNDCLECWYTKKEKNV